jgi:hypothetical protein
MTDDFDISLRRRLEAVAAAVPISPAGVVTAVAPRAVRTTPGSRLAVAGLVPVIAVVVVGTLLASLAGVGPFAGSTNMPPSDGASPPNPPIEATTRLGDFELTIRSAKSRYSGDEPVDVTASLTYVGPDDATVIRHQIYGPINFEIEPQPDGVGLQPSGPDVCAPLELQRDIPSIEQLAEIHEVAPVYLPEGRFAMTSSAFFRLGECVGDGIGLEATVEIDVGPRLNPPLEATTRFGEFELTIRSSKSTYVSNEPIAMEASLSYRGGAAAIDVWHASGVGRTPLGFGIEEPVQGHIRLEPGWDAMCGATTIQRGRPITVQFAKMGGWSDQEDGAFFSDPVLRLTPGIWHVHAVAAFAIGKCSADPIEMRVDLEIEVVATPPPDASPPIEPTTTPGDPVHAVEDDETFRLELESSQSVYAAGEPLDIRATLVYDGESERMDFSGGVMFMGTQTDGTHSFVPPPIVDMCVIRPIGDLPIELALAEWPKVRSLPAGMWRISATFSGSAPACTGGGSNLRAWIDLTIVNAGEPARAIPLLTAEDVDEVSSDRFCRNDTPFGSGGRLALDATSGLGIASENGDIQPIRWPPGFSAEVLPDGAILYADGGQIAGREGDLISFPAGLALDGILSVCGQFLFW